jgi:hypothetical protein
MLHDLLFYSLPFVPIFTAIAVLYFDPPEAEDHLKGDRKEENEP